MRNSILSTSAVGARCAGVRCIRGVWPAHSPGRVRAGASILEVTVAVAVATALLGTASVMIVRLVGIQRNVETAGQQTVVLSRLARQFRSDVHAAGAITVNEDGTELLLQPLNDGGRPVKYSAGQRHLTRTVPGEEESRDEYRFSAGTSSRFQTEELPVPGVRQNAVLVRLEINRPWLPVPGASPLPRGKDPAKAESNDSSLISRVPVPLRIEAVATRHARLSGFAQVQETSP